MQQRRINQCVIKKAQLSAVVRPQSHASPMTRSKGNVSPLSMVGVTATTIDLAPLRNAKRYAKHEPFLWSNPDDFLRP